MKYTFLLPAYKTKYLRKALSSILNQSYTDFTILVSDDCSPEDIKSIVDEFDDSRISYSRNEQNIGAKNLVNHWNDLVSLAQSEYIILASDDDLYDKNFLEDIDNLTKKYPDANIFRGRCNRVDHNDEIIFEDDLYEEYLNQLKFAWSIFNTNYIGCIANYVIKTQPIKDIGGFVYFPFAWFSDAATVIQLAEKGIGNTTAKVFNFRLSGINISSTAQNKEMERGKMEATILFDQWMTSMIDSLSEQSSLLYKNYLAQLTSSYKKVIYSHTGDYSWAFSLKEITHIYSRLKKNKFFNKKSFFKSYILSVLYRKIH